MVIDIGAADIIEWPRATALRLPYFFGLTLGKPLGVITFSWLAVRSGIAVRPPSLDWGMVAGGGMLAGIGFTMALFIARSGVRRRSPQRREVGDPVGIGRLRGAGYGAAGLVVFQYTRGGRRGLPAPRCPQIIDL